MSKEKVLISDFREYRFLSELCWSPNGKAAAFVVSKANANNGYDAHVWVYRPEVGFTQMTFLGKIIPLLRVPYTYEKKPRLLKKIINIFINTSCIPKEIIDFYSQFEFSTYAEYAKEHNKNIQKTVS